ncbi:SCO family protein [Burkholderiaceae bacterium FT117]|uniref:SCO family protein n=1 Tax=Zeimonas sediminis TaxID=2944268 RepID=UPI002342D675|nr:SCO family protein [Zeimonas sediminis]MCM5569491.1 SCO family protein [Zeimonas sediminis]
MRWPERLWTLPLLSALLALLAGAAAAQSGPPSDVRRAFEISQAAIGNQVGDFALRDGSGKEVRLSDYRGQPLLVSFVYTGCFQVCPTTTRFLAQAVRVAREALGEDRFRIVSIGFNQPFDDPTAMAAFARQVGISDPHWAFLSPARADVAALTARFGFSYEATSGGFDHLLQVSIVDSNGVLYRQVYGESFDIPMLVQPLKELLSGEAERQFTLASVWDKVILYCTVYDPHTGGYRVDYSLFFELFAGITTLGAIAWVLLRELRRGRRARRA